MVCTRVVNFSILTSLDDTFFAFIETTDVVINELEVASKAQSLTQVANFADNLGQIQEDLARMRTITNNLRLNASQLSDGNFRSLENTKWCLIVK